MTKCSICDDFEKYMAIVKVSSIPEPDKSELLTFLQDRIFIKNHFIIFTEESS